MQADDIIQNKEWANLTSDEKFFISELASTESEFYLLKQMMNMSAEEAFDVPEVSVSVKDNIIGEISKRSPFKIQRYWYLTAAAIIAFGFLTFLLFQSKPKNDFVKVEIPQEMPVRAKPEITAPIQKSNKDVAINEIKENKSSQENTLQEKKRIKKFSKADDQFIASSKIVKHDVELLNSESIINGYELAKASSSIVSKEEIMSKPLMKEQAFASNNSVNKNKEFLNLITEIF